MISADNVLGKSFDHISFERNEFLACPVHYDVVTPLLNLQADAKTAGFDLRLVSGFRDFERQLKIWRAKAEGKRMLLDDHGNTLNFDTLSEDELLSAILRWSALPGASRHHWGTDVDVFDAASVSENYDVQLTSKEVEDDGPFSAMHDWLDLQIESGAAHGFFRPYAKDLGGVAPERWHLSYAPLSYEFQKALTKNSLLNAWRDINLPLLAQIEKRIDVIWNQFIWIKDSAYP